MDSRALRRAVIVALYGVAGLLPGGALAASGCTLFKEPNLSGAQISIKGNTSRPALDRGWDDEISSIKVASGCLLVGFKDKTFRGSSQTFGPGEYPVLPTEWDNHISSLQCNCL